MNIQTIDQFISIEPEKKILAKTVPAGEVEQVSVAYMGPEAASGGS